MKASVLYKWTIRFVKLLTCNCIISPLSLFKVLHFCEHIILALVYFAYETIYIRISYYKFNEEGIPVWRVWFIGVSLYNKEGIPVSRVRFIGVSLYNKEGIPVSTVRFIGVSLYNKEGIPVSRVQFIGVSLYNKEGIPVSSVWFIGVSQYNKERFQSGGYSL